MKRISILLLFLSVFALADFGQTKTVRLFHIERSSNSRNFVAYDANLTNGVPDAKKQIVAYWGWWKNPSRREDLTLFDKVGFGYSVKSLGNNEYSFTLRASSKKIFKLCRYKNNWIAKTTINGTEAQVTRMYVQMKSAMSADYLDIYGKDLETGKEVRERLK